MANSKTSKILVNYSTETVRFEYECSFDKFTTRIETFVTKEFAPPGRQEPLFSLSIDPYEDEVTVNLLLISPEKLKCKTSGWLLTKNGEIWKNIDFTNAISQNDYEIIYNENRSEITNPKNGLLPEDIFTFCCEFTLELETIYEKLTIARPIRKLDDKMQVLDDLEKLLQSGEFSDFEFTIGERKFPVHKAILHSRSPYFKAMFMQDFEEKASNSVPIEDIDADMFTELLEYLYTSKPPELTDEIKAIEVLIIADKYQLDSLKTIAENELSEKMTAESMFNLLMVADTYNAAVLKANAMKFIASKATSMDILKALFENELFGRKQSKTLMSAMRDLVKDE